LDRDRSFSLIRQDLLFDFSHIHFFAHLKRRTEHNSHPMNAATVLNLFIITHPGGTIRLNLAKSKPHSMRRAPAE
jgi:hypothetical protein